MSNEVNRIQVNRNYQINGAGSQPKEKTQQETQNEVENKQPEAKQIAAGDVLSYMAAQSISVKPQQTEKVLEVSKYVTSEQAERITGFVAQFEDMVANYSDVIDNELGSDVLSEDAKMNLAVEMFKADEMGDVSINKEEIQKAQMEKLPDVSKYVTPEQAKRIGGFITQFEDIIVKGLQNIENELGENTLSNDAKMDLMLELFNIENG